MKLCMVQIFSINSLHMYVLNVLFLHLHVTIYLKKTPHEFVQLPLTCQGSRTLTLAEIENVWHLKYSASCKAAVREHRFIDLDETDSDAIFSLWYNELKLLIIDLLFFLGCFVCLGFFSFKIIVVKL